MTDKEGNKLERGDLVMLVIKTPVENPSQLIVYLSSTQTGTCKEEVDDKLIEEPEYTLLYYPLTKDGLEVAKFDNGTNDPTLTRGTKFTATKVRCSDLIKMNPDILRGYKKTLFEEISNEL